MPNTKKRRVFEEGHHRKYLVIVDESPEVEAALYFAASRVGHTGGSVVLLYIIEPDSQFWGGVRQVQVDEETNKAKALFRLFKRKLVNAGLDAVDIEESIGEGTKSDQIQRQIDDDEDIAILVLGAATDAKGPGPLIAALVSGPTAGKFPIPITIVPGDLSMDEIKALA